MNKEIIKRFNKKTIEKRGHIFMLLLEAAGMLNLSASINHPLSLICTLESLSCFSFVLAVSYFGYNIEKEIYMVEQLKEKNKEQYLELKNIYNKYLDSLAQLILEIPFDSVLETCIFLDFLMEDGYFSITDKYEYKKFIENNDIYEDLLGTTVLTGQAVCRHNTAFMGDLLNRLNINNFKLHTYSMGKKKKLVRHDFSNHVMTGLVDNNQVFGYDFTHHYFAKIEDKNTISFANPNTGEIEKYFSIVKKENIDEYLKLQSLSIGSKELRELFKKTFDKYCFFKNLFAMLKIESEEIMNDIASKNLVLMPRK